MVLLSVMAMVPVKRFCVVVVVVGEVGEVGVDVAEGREPC